MLQNVLQWNTTGNLTPLGMHQLYKLGQIIRRRYIEDEELISPTFNYDDVFIRSSGFSRCYLSSVSLLTGLYPNSPFAEPIPDLYNTFAQDSVFQDTEILLRGFNLWYVSNYHHSFSVILLLVNAHLTHI